MSRYIDPVPQYFLNNGDIASDGKLYYFENLDYLTPKDTYDINGVVNTNPVVLDGSGRVPEIFGVDLYSVRLVSAAGETQWTIDNYNMSTGASTPSLVNPVITGNITLATLGARIRGDFSNSTEANRAAIQSSVLNGRTHLTLLPNGTAIGSSLTARNAQDPANSGYLRLNILGGNTAQLITGRDGTGTAPVQLDIGAGVNQWIYDVSGEYYPATDNAYDIGDATQRPRALYAANGTIQTSDERTKTNIEDCDLGLDFINALRPVSYKFIVGSNKVIPPEKEGNPPTVQPVAGQRTHYGLLAQQVKSSYEAAGVDFGGWILTKTDDPESQQGLRYDQFIAPLVKAVQELSEQNISLLERLEVLEGIVNP